MPRVWLCLPVVVEGQERLKPRSSTRWFREHLRQIRCRWHIFKWMLHGWIHTTKFTEWRRYWQTATLGDSEVITYTDEGNARSCPANAATYWYTEWYAGQKRRVKCFLNQEGKGRSGGERGIWTPGRVAPTLVFETSPFSRSGISPLRWL